MAKAAYTQALLDRAQAHATRPLNDRRYTDGLSEIAQLYGDITGEAVGSCRQCQYKDFLAVVTAYIREATRFLHPELMADSKYTFAPGFQGEVIADGRYTKTVTAENLTDEDAQALIPLGYGHVIVAKPGESLLAGASGEGDAGEGDSDESENQPSEREKELEQQLAQANETIANNGRAYHELEQKVGDSLGVQNQLAAEKQAHKATKGQLAKVQQQLAAANQKLTEKAAGTGTTDPANVPAVSTSDAAATPSAPAVTAPAPPTSPAEGTPGN